MQLIRVFVIRAVVIFAAAGSLFAQDNKPIEVDTEIVNVSVAVIDKKGQVIGDLSKEDFALYDNGKATPIAFFSNQDAPMSFGIVYDLHPATTEQSKSVLRSLKAFSDTLDANEDFFLTVFSEYGSLNVNFVPTMDQINRHLSFGERNEPNSLYDAVYYAGEKLRSRANQKKTLIIISDGKDHQSHHSFSELERLLDSFSVQIYAVILDKENIWDYDELSINGEPSRVRIDESKLDEAAIRALSRTSGGNVSASPAKNTIELFKIFEKIGGEMRDRYSLGFYPTKGGSHKLEVKLKKPDLKKVKLSYRKKYRIPPRQ